MTDHQEHEDEYTDEFVQTLELILGEGSLSLGGADEVAMVLDGVDIADIAGKSVLDEGCGVGGVDIALVRNHCAASVHGIDIEQPLIDSTVAGAAREGLSDRITYQKITPGQFPFADESCDVLFSKDAMIHIPDKPAPFADVCRVQLPSGFYSGSDWMRDDDEAATPEFERWIELLGLVLEFESQDRYQAALTTAEFDKVSLVDRREWARDTFRDDCEQLAGAKNTALRETAGDDADHYVNLWNAGLQKAVVGQLAPGHLRGFKPGG